MKVYSIKIAQKPSKNIYFKGRDEELSSENIDKFLSTERISEKQTFSELVDINRDGYNAKLEQIHTKRNANDIVEASNTIFNNPLDIYRRYDDSDLIERLFRTQNNESLGLFKIFASDKDLLKKIFKKGATHFAEGVENSSLINSIKMPEIMPEIIQNKSIKPTDLLRDIFIDFKKNDIVFFNNSMNCFGQISNNFFKHTSQNLKEIKDMKSTFQKWIERIPLLGIPQAYKRVTVQQQAIQFLYQDYNEYCNRYIHHGIQPIAQSYIQKIRRTQNYIDLFSTFVSQNDLKFFESLMYNMSAAAAPLLNKYINMLTSITSNGEALSDFYKKINSSGNIKLLIKTAKLSFLAV